MKKFLKRANRGLLLGGVILIALIIYIAIDYSRFSSEKDTIKKQIESYMDSFFTQLEGNDYNALSKLVNESWTGKAVMSEFYFTNIDEMVSNISMILNQTSNDTSKDNCKVSDVSYRITSNSIKKVGPNMASVTLKYTVSFNVSSNAYSQPEMPFPFGICYIYVNTDDGSSSVNKQYMCSADGEYTIYMYNEKGTWKFSQGNGYDNVGIREVK